MNKAVAYIRDAVNAVYNHLEKIEANRTVFSAIIRDLIKMAAPILPHMCEESWETLGFSGLVSENPWPSYVEEYLKVSSIDLPVQVNGKLRGTAIVGVDDDEETVFDKALKLQSVINALGGKSVKKKIFVKGKIVNFVV
jgi:leucyl-tRNA synthetase